MSKKILVVLVLIVGLFSGCSGLKVNPVLGVWTLESGPDFSLDRNGNVKKQLKAYIGGVPGRMLIQEDSVIFEIGERKVFQSASYKIDSDHFILHTVSDNQKTKFTFMDGNTRLSVLWSGQKYIYIKGGLAR